MSASQRKIAYNRAYERGKNDFLAGKPLSANPYKKGEWGLGGFWEMGWKDAKQEGEGEND